MGHCPPGVKVLRGVRNGGRTRGWGAGGGGEYSLVACLGYLTIDHAPRLRLSTVSTTDRYISNVWAFSCFLPCITQK